jgi:hypothetical protein
MPLPQIELIFTLLGPLFLMLGVIRFIRGGKLVPQARAWLMLGAIFCAVAFGLWLQGR